MAWLPPASVAVLKVALPLAERLLTPRTVEKSLNVTEPVGTGEDPEPDRMVAVRVMGCPNVVTIMSEVIATRMPRTGSVHGSIPSAPSLAAKNSVPLTFVKYRG